ncbi:MAG: hypothetical protein A4S09_09700 [Proteobacteria bacterium SG_bin7]|nr:MAG: hypothetical protein A4S09_09700 [Proteobacteria bacterium SG_bin7]
MVAALISLGFTSVLPENNFRLLVHQNRSNISEEQFDSALEKIKQAYEPVIKDRGAELVILKDWMDTTVNAYAFRENNQWYISFYGGMARHSEMTEDGFLLTACHAIGHHLGGFPRVEWSSVEANADYFSTLKCLRRIWSNGDSIEVVAKMEIDRPVKEKCEKQWKKELDQAICMRSAMAGKSLARLLSVLVGEDSFPEFRAPDETVVTKTNESHINSQCRLDTYFQGALCDADWKIPAGENDPNSGACRFRHVGGRPACWYYEKPTFSISQFEKFIF